MSWPDIPLGEIATISRDIVDPIDIPDGTLYVGLENISSGGELSEVARVSNGDLASSKFRFTRDHVLFGKLRPYLAKVARPTFEGVCSTDILPLLAGPKLSRDYLTHYLLKPTTVALAAARSTGANLPRLSPAALLEFAVPLPPLAEQCRIAAILDKAEELRAKRRAALALLETLPQSIFLEVFGDPATNPKGWPFATVGEIADVQGGLQVTAARNALPCEAPYLRVANVFRGYLDLKEIKTIRATEAELKRTTLLRGDLLVVEGHGNKSEIGRVAVWDGSIERCVHQNHLIRVRLSPNCAHYVFASHFLNSDRGRQALLRSGKTTSGLNTISVSDIRRTPFLLPKIDAQLDFAARITAIQETKAAHQAILAKLGLLFESIQAKAFAHGRTSEKVHTVV